VLFFYHVNVLLLQDSTIGTFAQYFTSWVQH
jgi:hypothetical protein